MSGDAYRWPTEEEQPPEVRQTIALVKAGRPNVRWTRIWVRHPGADDDGLWWFWLPDLPGEVQIESSHGACPFLVETDKHGEVVTAHTVEETAATVIRWLALPGGRADGFFHPR